jgi:quercetin dioxygenase-like cupin family protein
LGRFTPQLKEKQMRTTFLSLLASLFIACAALAADQFQAVKLSDIKWSPCDPKNPQDPCQVNYFHGNAEKEPNHSYFRVPKGHTFSAHWHTGNSHLVVLKGVFVVGAENDSKGTALRAGDYAFEAAKWIHWGKCDADECVAYYYVDGPDSYIDVKDKRP